MQFDLNEKYRVTTDRYNVMLEKKHTTEKTERYEGGKIEWQKFYYSSFKALLRALADKTFRDVRSPSELAQNHAEWVSLVESIPDKVCAAVDASKLTSGKRVKEHAHVDR